MNQSNNTPSINSRFRRLGQDRKAHRKLMSSKKYIECFVRQKSFEGIRTTNKRATFRYSFLGGAKHFCVFRKIQ